MFFGGSVRVRKLPLPWETNMECPNSLGHYSGTTHYQHTTLFHSVRKQSCELAVSVQVRRGRQYSTSLNIQCEERCRLVVYPDG